MALNRKLTESPTHSIDAAKAQHSPGSHQKIEMCEPGGSRSKEGSAEKADIHRRQQLWQQGCLSMQETLALFQELVDTGLAWKATGAVRRTAARLILDGRIQRAPEGPESVPTQIPLKAKAQSSDGIALSLLKSSR